MILKKMKSLRNDIKKATSLASEDDEAKFYRLHGLSQAARDKKMNQRVVKKPQNLGILSDSDEDEDSDDDCRYAINNKVKPTFDKYEVFAAIKEVNGGRDFSNKSIEENYYRQLQKEAKSEEDIPQSSPKCDNIKTSQPKSSNNKCGKKKDRLFKNAAIMGLVNTNKISLQDLNMFNNENSEKEENEFEDNLLGIASNGCIMNDNAYQVQSVPLREDPDICVHPLQLGLDERQFKHLDFSQPSIAKKKIMTPPEYFLSRVAIDDFGFVKMRISKDEEEK